MNAAKRLEIYRRLRAQNPHPRGELEYRTPFELLIAVVLSAQATDKSVNLATAKLFPRAKTPRAMLKLGEAGLIPYIQTIGLFRTKARNIVALCQKLLAEHGGEVPADREQLMTLPGVGRKTANVVPNVAFGQPTIAVDTHILSRREPHRAGAWKRSRRSRTQAHEVHAGGISPRRAPLADSPRALRLRGAQAEMPRVPDRRSVRIPRQNRLDRSHHRSHAHERSAQRHEPAANSVGANSFAHSSQVSLQSE